MTHSQFSYERLHVHTDMIEFLCAAEEHVSAWEPIHAVVDQFERASEGFLVSLAEASRAHALGTKTAAVDCSLGSVLECGACMDIAEVKSLLEGDVAHRLNELAERDDIKAVLVRVDAMTAALARRWSNER